MVDGVLTRRVLAFLVDGVLCSVILAFIWAFLLLFGVFTLGLGFALFGLLPAIPFLYNWLSVCCRLSATPGQRLLGLIVVRRADLGRPTPLEGLIWTAGFVVTLSLGVVWFAAALVTLHHRTLHDVVSGLLVVRRKSLTARPALWDAPRRGPGFAEYV
jgi:uncharacterized RDD family membrane protein YckC